MKILYIDIGSEKIEMASCNEAEDTVSGQQEIKAASGFERIIIDTALSYGAKLIVIGSHKINGRITKITPKAKNTCKILSESLFGEAETELWDEVRLENIDDIKNNSATFGPHNTAAVSSKQAVYLLRCYLTQKHSGKK